MRASITASGKLSWSCLEVEDKGTACMSGDVAWRTSVGFSAVASFVLGQAQ